VRKAGARQAAEFALEILGHRRSLSPGPEAPFACVDQRRSHLLVRIVRQGRLRQFGRHAPSGQMCADGPPRPAGAGQRPRPRYGKLRVTDGAGGG